MSLKRNFESKKRQLVMLAALLLLVVGFMVFLNVCSHRSATNMHPFGDSFIPGTGDTINVAIEYNPSIYIVRGDSVSGKDYEILQEISRAEGVPFKYYPFVPLQKALDGLDDGRFDLVVASLPLTTGLRESYLMSDPVYLNREILVQLSDSTHTPIKSQMDLAGDTVWITTQSPMRTRLENLAAEIGDTIYVKSSPEYSAEALFILTAKGKIRYAVINEGIAKALHPQYQQVDISTPISFTQFQAWAMRKDNQVLADSINSWLSKNKGTEAREREGETPSSIPSLK